GESKSRQRTSSGHRVRTCQERAAPEALGSGLPPGRDWNWSDGCPTPAGRTRGGQTASAPTGAESTRPWLTHRTGSGLCADACTRRTSGQSRPLQNRADDDTAGRPHAASPVPEPGTEGDTDAGPEPNAYAYADAHPPAPTPPPRAACLALSGRALAGGLGAGLPAASTTPGGTRDVGGITATGSQGRRWPSANLTPCGMS